MADDFESMRDFARSIDERARAGLQPLPAADERYFPVQNVEGLVFPMMRMIRRRKPHRCLQVLNQRERSVRRFRSGPHHGRHAKESEGCVFSRRSEERRVGKERTSPWTRSLYTQRE